jgi:hypothetical protein
MSTAAEFYRQVLGFAVASASTDRHGLPCFAHGPGGKITASGAAARAACDLLAHEKVLAAMAMRDAVVIQQSAPKMKAPMGKLTGARQKITKAKIVSVPSVKPPR